MTTHPARHFALGAHFDTPHRLRMYAPALGSGSRALFTTTPTLSTGTVSMAAYESLRRDQGNVGGCEAAAGAMAGWMAFLAANDPLPWFPSEDGIYKDARAQARIPNPDGTLPPLTDSGSMTSDVITISRTCGWRKSRAPAPDGRNSDLDPATTNNEPRLDELDEEAEAPILIDPGSFLVDLSDTKQALAVIQQALAMKYPVRADIIADTALQNYFLNWTPSTPPLDTCDPNDPNAGGHAVVQDGLLVKSSSDGIVDILNSWGDCGAPPIVQEGPNTTGHLQATFNWFKLAVMQVTVWKCSRVQS